MPRRPRVSTGNYVYHALNRAVGGSTLFANEGDYAAFERVLQEAHERTATRLLAYCIMPSHWHLVLWPKEDGELSEYMRWLTVTHTQRWHARHETSGTGPLYQGRFKSFPVQADGHFYAVCRYVERNALRAGLVHKAELWRWCSLWQWANHRADVALHRWPLPRPDEWIKLVNQVETEAELAAVRQALRRGSPFGAASWQKHTAVRLGLESTLRARGRPRKL